MKNSLDKETTTKFWDAAKAMHNVILKEKEALKKKRKSLGKTKKKPSRVAI